MFSLRKLEGATKKARLNELRKHPRLVVGCRVDATWEADGETRQTSGRCLDISVGGARI
jgi:hypothetical protein